MRCPPITPRRCAAAPLARPGDPTVSRVLRWAPVSIGRQGGQTESTNSIFCYFIPPQKYKTSQKVLSFIRSIMNLCSFCLWFSVAFSKICPAGKGYFIQSIREILPFPPIFTRKNGESVNAVRNMQAALQISLFNHYLLFFFLFRHKTPGEMLFRIFSS